MRVTADFDEFVHFGLTLTDNIHDGFPWSFTFAGVGVTHENNDCYLLGGKGKTLRFERGDLLVLLVGDNDSSVFVYARKE